MKFIENYRLYTSFTFQYNKFIKYLRGVMKVGENMNNQELCILLDSILALLETDNAEKAKEVIKNSIKRIDKGMTSSSEK